MPEEKLTIEHRELVQQALKAAGVPLSEYSFTNLYLFREVHNYMVVTGEHCTYIKGITRDGLPYGMPLCNLSNIDTDLAQKAAAAAGMIFPIAERDLNRFDPEIFEWSYNIDDSDYLFTVEKMSTYPGRHLHKKRNLMKQFMELYSWTAEDLDQSRIKDALFILEQWQKGTGAEPEASDYFSCAEALSNTEGFLLSGVIYYIDDKPAGFLLGERITEDTYALHFAKGNTEYKGLYQFMYNHFAKTLHGSCEWINFEQDLGIAALRQAKESYQPDAMGHKYRVQLKGTAVQ